MNLDIKCNCLDDCHDAGTIRIKSDYGTFYDYKASFHADSCPFWKEINRLNRLLERKQSE